MSRNAKQILGDEEFSNLQHDFMEELENGANYGDIEDLMLGYGLEMDYLFDVIGF